MIMNVTFLTHMGGVREENQDAVFISDVVMTGNMRAPKICNFDSRDYPILLAVIDGMGGYTGGALAAKIVGETLADSCKIQKKNLFNACQDANECKLMLFQLFSKAICRMNEKVQNNPIFSKMGVAVSGILLRERNALTFNCGDCRVYRLRDGSLELVTRDHSVVQNLFEQEEISEDEMRNHPRKNIITSAISADCENKFELYIKELSYGEGDSFFLCSDGVWETFSRRELTNLLERNSTMLGTANELFGALMSANCRDNVSFIHCRIGR